MNYWLTTHWPPHVDEAADGVAAGVWLPEGREAAGAAMAKGDLVLIYHAKGGPAVVVTEADGSVRMRRCHTGREGIVAIGEVVSRIEKLEGSVPERYDDGSEIWWRWHAPLNLLSRSGFVSRTQLLPVLNYSSNYNLHGFGDQHSGLKRLTPDEFERLRAFYRASVPVENKDAGSAAHGGGESQPHLDLKEYVAANPSVVLNEPNVDLVAVERPFPTGDRADIVLRDQLGRIIGLEIEITVPTNDLTGALQAIKYRRMLEMATGAKHGDSRAILVAYQIADDVARLCASYEVECFEVNEQVVAAWRNSQAR